MIMIIVMEVVSGSHQVLGNFRTLVILKSVEMIRAGRIPCQTKKEPFSRKGCVSQGSVDFLCLFSACHFRILDR